MKAFALKIVTAFALIAIGFGLGCFFAPAPAQSGDCLGIGGAGRAAWAYCDGAFYFYSPKNKKILSANITPTYYQGQPIDRLDILVGK